MTENRDPRDRVQPGAPIEVHDVEPSLHAPAMFDEARLDALRAVIFDLGLAALQMDDARFLITQLDEARVERDWAVAELSDAQRATLHRLRAERANERAREGER